MKTARSADTAVTNPKYLSGSYPAAPVVQENKKEVLDRSEYAFSCTDSSVQSDRKLWRNDEYIGNQPSGSGAKNTPRMLSLFGISDKASFAAYP
jgi:hypothetical protein